MWVGDGTLNGAPWQTAAVLALAAADVRPVRAPPPGERDAAVDASDRRARVASAPGRPPTPPRAAPRRPAGRRRRRDVRRRAGGRLARRSTSTTSCTPRRSCSSTGRTRSRARTPSSSTGTTSSGRRSPRSSSRRSPLLSPTGADWTIAIVGLAAFMLSLRIVGVRDWRVYGAFALWPSVVGEIRVSHLTPFLCLLLARRLALSRHALRARARDRAGRCDQVLPLAARRLARGDRARARDAHRRRRRRRVAPSRPARSPASTTTSARCSSSGRTFDQDSYSPFGFLVQIGAPESLARVVSFAIGAALLVGCWRRASLGLAVAAALVLSPIVWLDYYAVAAVPLAVVRPRLSARLARAARDLGSPERRNRRRQRLGQRPRAHRVRDRVRGDRASGRCSNSGAYDEAAGDASPPANPRPGALARPSAR